MSIIEKAIGQVGAKRAHAGIERPEPSSDGFHADAAAPSPSTGPTDAASAAGSGKTVPIDLGRLAAMGFAVAPEDGGAQADDGAHTREEFRLIKRPLLLNAFGEAAASVPRGNVIMVTSAVAGEGKTFCSINLALSVAMERDRRVLLVDADLQRPMVATTLGIPQGPGLVDLLENPSLDPGEVFVNTSVSRLSVLPAGSRHQFGTELLASEAMKAFVQELSERYPDRLVLFDSPPLLAATQAVVLAGLAGQIVMVVGAGSTSQEAVTEALGMLDAEKPIGLVLNRYPRVFRPEYYYG